MSPSVTVFAVWYFRFPNILQNLENMSRFTLIFVNRHGLLLMRRIDFKGHA